MINIVCTRNQLWLTLILVFVLGNTGCKSQTLKDQSEIELPAVISFARLHFSDYAKEYIRSEVYHNFDFGLLAVSQRESQTVSSVKSFYNNDNQIVKVVLGSKFADSDFEFLFVRNPEHGYTIFFAKQVYDTEIENEQNDVVNGFFLVHQGHCYFVGFQEPLCIMQLNGELNAIQTLRFKSNKLLYRTKVNYRNLFHLYSETFYVPKTSFEFTNETSISDVQREFDSKSDFQFNKALKIGWVKSDDHLPLWIFGGRHEYDLSEKP